MDPGTADRRQPRGPWHHRRACPCHTALRYDEPGWGGRAVECAGLENREAADRQTDENTDSANRSADQSDAEKRRLVAVPDMEPELREVVEVWKLLDEPVRLAILHLVRAKSR